MFFSGSPVALFHACLQIFWYMCQEFVSCIPCHYKQRISHKAYVYSAKRYNTQFFFCCVCTFPSSTTQLTAAANVCAGVAFQDAEVLERARARHARAPPASTRWGALARTLAYAKTVLPTPLQSRQEPGSTAFHRV